MKLVDQTTAPAAARATLDQIGSVFDTVPNMFKAVANSPAALASMWGAFGALGKGGIGAKLGEQIAVAIADRNRCRYCLAAHTVPGQKAGATAAEMSEAQRGRAADPRTAAALGALLGLLAATPPRAVARAQDVQEAPAGCAGGTCPAPVDIPR